MFLGITLLKNYFECRQNFAYLAEANEFFFLYFVYVFAKLDLKYLAITAAIVLVIVSKGMDLDPPDDRYFQHIPQYFVLCLRQEPLISVRFHRNCEPASKEFGKISRR